MKLKRLSPDEFDSLPWMAKTRFHDQTWSILRAVLVDGRTQADVATEYGVSKQRVNSLMGDFKRNYIAQAAATSNAVVSVTLEMPEQLALEVAGLLDALKACTDEDKKTEALEKAQNAVRRATKLLKGST
ncbi:TrfB-related DNA-binding protein [Ralstonia insidiosa]|nr:TrfB-related DNA-binding protein [Ralstonia insidiosa]MDE4928787.1 TrfB-related DNA-binding protein [Ralstonia insidiosa]